MSIRDYTRRKRTYKCSRQAPQIDVLGSDRFKRVYPNRPQYSTGIYYESGVEPGPPDPCAGSVWPPDMATADAVTAAVVNSDAFGQAVAIDGDVLVVGAWNQTRATGAAYIFEWDGSTWVETANFSGENTGDSYGYAVSVSSDTVVVGAPDMDRDGRSNVGKIYVYTKVGGVWSEQQAWQGDVLSWVGGPYTENQELGKAVAIDGDIIVAGGGAQYISQQHAFAYHRTAGVWTKKSELVPTPISGATYTYYANCVAVSGTRAVVGAKGDDPTATDAGSAFVFDYDSGADAWSLTQKLTASDAGASDRFGASVAVDGDTIAVAADWWDSPTLTNVGAVYIFELGATWVESQKCVATGLDLAGCGMGEKPSSLCIKCDAVVAGAFRYDASKGRVFGFKKGTDWTTYTAIAFDSATPTSYEAYGYALSYDGSRLAVGAPNNCDTGNNGIKGYVFVSE